MFRSIYTTSTLILCVGSFLFFSLGHLVGDQEKLDETFEAEIHQRADSAKRGYPQAAPAEKNATLKLNVRDAKTGKPLFCRVNVIGSDGDYYEPENSGLSPWSLQRAGNRSNKGPFRYYGWFFYSNGQDEVQVPVGKTRIEVWKGFEYRPTTMEIDLAAGEPKKVEIRLAQLVDFAQKGWFSGDPHIHIDRKTDENDQRIFDLLEAEDIKYGQILCYNDTSRYQPVMSQQESLQLQGFGKKSERTRGKYAFNSGQEYRCGSYGHILLLGADRLVEAGGGISKDPNNWPVFGVVADETHALGGQAIHAHGGYSKAIYADFAQQATDGVELLQFAVYRGIGLEGWYHILNAGFRFPASGASDYPYCRALGDCRTYAWVPENKRSRGSQTGYPEISAWNEAVKQGRSFFTTGPLVEFSVNGKRPGEELALSTKNSNDTNNSNKGQEFTLQVKAECLSLVAPVQELQLIQGGEVIARKSVTKEEGSRPIVWELETTVQHSSWLALRAWAPSQSGKENVEAHTNPVYVVVNKRPFHNANSLNWLLDQLSERIEVHAARDFPEKKRVLKYYERSRGILAALLSKAEAAE